MTTPRAAVAVVQGKRTAWAAPARPVSVAIGLGSNQGDRLDHLRRALFALLTHPEIRVQTVSPVYETEYVGPGRQVDYLNACVELKTRLAPKVLLSVLQGTEQRLGRAPGGHMRPRIIDLDILLYGDRVVADGALTVPHPRLVERAFVLAPLADLMPIAGISLAESPRTGYLFGSRSWTPAVPLWDAMMGSCTMRSANRLNATDKVLGNDARAVCETLEPRLLLDASPSLPGDPPVEVGGDLVVQISPQATRRVTFTDTDGTPVRTRIRNGWATLSFAGDGA